MSGTVLSLPVASGYLAWGSRVGTVKADSPGASGLDGASCFLGHHGMKGWAVLEAGDGTHAVRTEGVQGTEDPLASLPQAEPPRSVLKPSLLPLGPPADFSGLGSGPASS